MWYMATGTLGVVERMILSTAAAMTAWIVTGSGEKNNYTDLALFFLLGYFAGTTTTCPLDKGIWIPSL